MSYKNLEVYSLSRELSYICWQYYKHLPKNYQYDIGNQLIRAIDSVGANIAEGYGRFHYLDSTRFYYNSRGSLYESEHWLELLLERELISQVEMEITSELIKRLGIKLNNFIKANKKNST